MELGLGLGVAWILMLAVAGNSSSGGNGTRETVAGNSGNGTPENSTCRARLLGGVSSGGGISALKSSAAADALACAGALAVTVTSAAAGACAGALAVTGTSAAGTVAGAGATPIASSPAGDSAAGRSAAGESAAGESAAGESVASRWDAHLIIFRRGFFCCRSLIRCRRGLSGPHHIILGRRWCFLCRLFAHRGILDNRVRTGKKITRRRIEHPGNTASRPGMAVFVTGFAKPPPPPPPPAFDLPAPVAFLKPDSTAPPLLRRLGAEKGRLLD
ncbi:hypothetical protein T492DRAFT_838605 [Pavlovales sp. CCMP2436]|nr:hypothetical protein T492DRAFT_838605 [Pavlovales sp. CCMP2436]